MATVLKLGSKGPEVKALQEQLNTILKLTPKLTADGDFGPNTDAAVKKFQAQMNLGIDGIIGPKTRQILDASEKQKTIVSPPYCHQHYD